jgi:aspartate kinase
MISTSPIKISCVISADRVPDAVKALHDAFDLGADAVRPEDQDIASSSASTNP